MSSRQKFRSPAQQRQQRLLKHEAVSPGRNTRLRPIMTRGADLLIPWGSPAPGQSSTDAPREPAVRQQGLI